MSPEAAPGDLPGPPRGVPGRPWRAGWLLRFLRDRRVAFLIVGGVNTVIGFLCFAGFLLIFGRSRYLVALPSAYVVSVLIAFVLYRFVVFRVRGHLLADLWRFATVSLSTLAFNFVALPVLVELAHLPVLLAQVLIVVVASMMSWIGHTHYSFRRTPSSEEQHR